MNPKICPTCHRSIPPTAPGGFCPFCILRDAEEPPPGHPAPALAEVAAAFPQFEILSLIGQGGMGTVFKVRQPGLDRLAALKILCPDLGRDPAFAERFAREARVLAKLNHPNIVSVFEHGESGGLFYLLMEFVDGVNLRQAMRAGRFTPEQALAVVPGICDALQAAHTQGIWHRDIKPENILLDAQGMVKIVDFGIARLVGDPARDFTLTRTGAALGSAAYMAPEQHEKPHEVDHRADIYSLGVVIYEMLTGELPLGRFPAPSRRAAVSARIDEIVFQTLEKERELRQQSAAEVKTDVHRATRDGEPPVNRTKGAELPLWVPWAVGLIAGGFTMLAFSRNVGPGARTAGVILHAIGGVAVVLGVMCAAFFAYVSRPAKWTAGLGVFVGLAILLLFFVGEMGVNGLVLLVAASVGIWAYGASKEQPPTAPSSNQTSTSAGHHHHANWLPFALYLLILTSAVLLGSLALMTGYDFPSEKGWVVGMGGFVFVATAGVLYFPLGSLRKRWAGVLTKFKRLHWGLAAVAILAAALVAKQLDGNWPNANYQEVVCGRVEGKPPSLELLPLLLQAAGDRAGAYQLSGSGELVQVKAMGTQQGHATACLNRLNQLLPAAVKLTCEPEMYAAARFTNTPRALVWGVASLAAILTTLLGGRRAGWLVVEGVVLHGWFMLMPAWPMAGLPKLVSDPPLPPFTVAELPDTSDFSTPENAMRSLIDAAQRQQVDIVKMGVSKGLTAMLNERSQWREFIEITGSTRPLVEHIEPDSERNLVRVTMWRSRGGHHEDIYLTKEDGRWKQDSLYVPGAMIEPLSVKAVENAPPAAVPSAPPVPTAEEVFRKMVAAANAADGEEFVKHEYRSSGWISFGDPPPVASRMAPFFGEILLVKPLPLRSHESTDATRLIARMKAKDGSIGYREFQFIKQSGRNVFLTENLPNYRAVCRIEFRPDQGKAASILKLHLGETPFTPVPGADGQFDIGADESSADLAVQRADHHADQLLESLKKAGQHSFFKIIQRAKTPDTPWLGEEAPTAEKPTP